MGYRKKKDLLGERALPVTPRTRGRRKLFKTDEDAVSEAREPLSAAFPATADLPSEASAMPEEPEAPPWEEGVAAGDAFDADANANAGVDADADVEDLRHPVVCPPVAQVFDEQGPLAALLGPRYCLRPGQVQMANLVRQTLQTCQHAVIEAGTGIGKSFAYLVPILWSGVPAIVSTSNKALMNQLWDKDVPQLRAIAPRPFKAALLKGRRNYICTQLLKEFRQQRWLPGFSQDSELLEAALAQEPSGDCERMDLPAELRSRLTMSSRDCKGFTCPQFKDCFYELAKLEAQQSDLVITNHALLCYNVLLSANRLLPVRPILVIDEAHQLVNYAINALTVMLEHDLFWQLVNHKLTRDAAGETDLLREIRECYDGFFEAVVSQRPRAQGAAQLRASDGSTANKWALSGEIQEGLALWDALKRVHGELQRLSRSNNDEEMDFLLTQSLEIASNIESLARPEPEDYIRYCEVQPKYDAARAYQVQYRPLEVAGVLNQSLFAEWPRVICTSATLSVNRNLDWFCGQVGAVVPQQSLLTSTLRSPFDYPSQMLVYIPRGLEPAYGPAEDAYAERLIAEVRRLLEASAGRALVLCTSRRRMQQLYQALAPELRDRYPCYCQGTLSQPEIITRFKAAGNAVIFATRSFWEGIDIPGEALSLVILDKIPFVPINDPVVVRHESLIKARGGNAFKELQLGSAILNLRQGAGRLIRAESDRGVIALLDSRVITKRYGGQILRSLPEGCHTADFEDVRRFFSLE